MRKLCTRQHFIEYLSYNFVEKQCLLARCLWQRYHYDYGMDGFVMSVNEHGEVGNQILDIQVKATEKLKKLKGNELFVFDLSIQDIVNWLDADAYVLLVIYEARVDVCYFVDIEDYFGKNRHELAKGNKFVRVYFSKEANFDQIIVEKFKQHNDRIWKNPTGL